MGRNAGDLQLGCDDIQVVRSWRESTWFVCECLRARVSAGFCLERDRPDEIYRSWLAGDMWERFDMMLEWGEEQENEVQRAGRGCFCVGGWVGGCACGGGVGGHGSVCLFPRSLARGGTPSKRHPSPAGKQPGQRAQDVKRDQGWDPLFLYRTNHVGGAGSQGVVSTLKQRRGACGSLARGCGCSNRDSGSEVPRQARAPHLASLPLAVTWALQLAESALVGCTSMSTLHQALEGGVDQQP